MQNQTKIQTFMVIIIINSTKLVQTVALLQHHDHDEPCTSVLQQEDDWRLL